MTAPANSPTTATGPALRARISQLRASAPTHLLAGASLVALLVISNDDPWIFGGTAVVCFVALPRRGLLLSPWLWTGLAVAIGLRQLATWHTIDDHAIAATYWCGALALGLRARDVDGTLAASARWLIGGVFAFAAGWKLLSGQFVDSTFFRYSLLFDDRFDAVAEAIGGTTDQLRHEGVAQVDHVLFASDPSPVTITEGPRNQELARVFTWWGLLIEAAVAVAFLAPLHDRWGWIRHAALLSFAGTTYLVVPIGGFGTLLLVLGAAMVTTTRARTAYYLAALALLAWSGIWPLLFL